MYGEESDLSRGTHWPHPPYGYGLPPSFPPQTLIIVPMSGINRMMMMMMMMMERYRVKQYEGYAFVAHQHLEESNYIWAMNIQI